MLSFLVSILFWAFFSYCGKLICEKTGKDPGVLIWIPIVQIVPLMEVAKMPLWMIVLFIIPFVNLVALAMLGMGLAKARGKSPGIGILLAVPCVNIFPLPYLAFVD